MTERFLYNHSVARIVDVPLSSAEDQKRVCTGAVVPVIQILAVVLSFRKE